VKRRVVVTGLGAVTPLGSSLGETRAALEEDRSGLAPAASFSAGGFREGRAAEVTDFDARAHFRVPKALKLTERKTRFAVAAAEMALRDAGWPGGEAARSGLGVLLGSSGSDLGEADLAHALSGADGGDASDMKTFASRILDGLNPLWLLVNLPNMVSAHVAIQLDARGPNSTVMTDSAAGLQAVGEAADWIRSGEAAAVLAGGADTGVFAVAYAGFEQAGLFGEGFVPGEGAAALLLEEREHALARGARFAGEILGYASSAGPSALEAALHGALADAGLGAEDVGVVAIASIHVERFRSEEREALRAVFPGRLPTVVERTSRLGFLFAAAGPLELSLLLGAETGGVILSAAAGLSGAAVAVAARTRGGESERWT
jgi:3-oxoacyl-[acyl-carrier-protein] synthase II